MRHFILKALVLACVLVAPASLRAEDIKENAVTVTQSAAPRDFLKTESTGLLHGMKEGGMGDGAWRGSDRAAIEKLIQDLPLHSKSPALQHLIKAVLLSSSSTADLKDAKTVVPGQDLLTWRISKLLAGGYYETALELYTAVPEEEYFPALKKAGIIAMLGSGQKPVACLEVKSYDNGDADPVFWDSIRTYCDYTLSGKVSDEEKAAVEGSPYGVLKAFVDRKPVQGPYSFAYTPESFEALSKFGQAILIAEHAIHVPNFTPEELAAIPPSHLSALIAQKNLSADLNLRLQTLAADYGLVDTAALTALYKAYEGDSFKLATIYKALAKADDDTATPAQLLHALELKDQYSIGAYLPYAKYLEQDFLNDLSEDNLRFITSLLYRTKRDMPDVLVQNFVENYGDFEEFSPKMNLLLVFQLLGKTDKSDELGKIVHKINTDTYTHNFFSINILESLDKGLRNVDNANKVYEKDFILTSDVRHVMPTQDLWDKLNQVGKDKVLGEAVLLSIYALDGVDVTVLYPGFFNDLQSNLNEVGLIDISRDLAVEGLLGMKQ